MSDGRLRFGPPRRRSGSWSRRGRSSEKPCANREVGTARSRPRGERHAVGGEVAQRSRAAASPTVRRRRPGSRTRVRRPRRAPRRHRRRWCSGSTGSGSGLSSCEELVDVERRRELHDSARRAGPWSRRCRACASRPVPIAIWSQVSSAGPRRDDALVRRRRRGACRSRPCGTRAARRDRARSCRAAG